MSEDMLPEEKLSGQLAFFPEMESDEPAPLLENMHPIPPPVPEQLDHWHICILLSDILLRFDGVLPEDWLYDIAVTSGHFSYFVYMDALGALIEQQAVTRCQRDGTDCLALTRTGTASVKGARLYVPKYFRDTVHLTALRYVARQNALRDLKIDLQPDGREWALSFACYDREREMMSLRFHAPTKESAELLSERILRNPARFFGKLLDLALTNEEEQYDLSDN